MLSDSVREENPQTGHITGLNYLLTVVWLYTQLQSQAAEKLSR